MSSTIRTSTPHDEFKLEVLAALSHLVPDLTGEGKFIAHVILKLPYFWIKIASFIS